MTRVLMISSFTATSHVGSVVSAFVLRRMGIDVTVLPTTLFGRHPGWGSPGGNIVPSSQLEDMWDAVQTQSREQGLPFDAVMTGYMGETGHVELAETIIRTLNPPLVLVDPVMGDGSRAREGLYIDADRAEAICDRLIPLANIATPNLWEWRFMTGNLSEDDPIPPRPLTGINETLVTSVTSGPQIGAMLFEAGRTHTIMHDRFQGVPNGGGDALAAAYLGHRLSGTPPREAMGRAVSAIFAVMQAANAADAGELPLIRAQHFLQSAATGAHDDAAPNLTIKTTP
ncbi:pyridoxal kinase [Algimonas porphyrae]|uniref:pyridoxal kinase n=2 Tax=Algimonas porphyrae TaxID=1128113 RepID=A0ABQ5V169_9PROT|nr:bifunctional hydroxymethylpyrimidine kinase/phosphomethylpyrimidine kinase [Algimonas porphyrae]GLQ20687.1 pyridoxal kinase [Algimonas porphyrae]